jgi:hypothetical protein
MEWESFTDPSASFLARSSMPAVTRSAARAAASNKEEEEGQGQQQGVGLYERAKQQRARQAQRVAEATAKECTFK